MDLIDDPREGENAPEFTVSELSGAVKRVVEGEFGFVRVRGEIGRVSRPRSGHVYLDLKDDRAVLSGVIWKGVCQRLVTQPEEGLEVVATGRLTTFPGQSKYQIVIDDIRPAGVGALMAMLEKRKAQLAAEGLFDAERKRPLPYLPEIVGVVTSPSGAVIRDILHRLRDRFPRKVLVWPVAVQGDRCAGEVARAIEGFNALLPGGVLPRPDVLIVARGGGSIEDLWGFNEEVVARAAAASEIPLISAVGHETDTTLIDFVADRRAPTPTAAAEMAVPVRLELMATLDQSSARMSRCVTVGMTRRRDRLRDVARALPRKDALLATPTQTLDRLSERLPHALERMSERKRAQVNAAAVALRPGVLRRRVEGERTRLAGLSKRLTPALLRLVARRREGLAGLRLRPGDLIRRRAEGARDLDRLSRAARRAYCARVGEARERLESMERLRQTLGYTATLSRGYAVVRDDKGSLITDRDPAAQADRLEIEFCDGRLDVVPAGRPPAGPAPKAAPKSPPKPKSPPEGQGSLF